MPNILDLEVRKQIIADINSDENKKRKNESIRRFDIYQKRQARYLREQLVSEYSKQTVNEMRVISSINLGSRIVDAQASLYTSEPTRTFSKSNGTPLSDAEKKQMDALYRANNFNVAMKRSNRYYKLEQQGAIQIIPRDGVIHARVLLPHHYDVVPNEFNPEMADAYVINVYDRSLLYNQALLNNGMQPNYSVATDSDQINQITADSDDFKSKSSQRHIWWSKDFNFITNGHGAMIDEMGRGIPADIALIGNPIQELPFIDIASGKEFEFWIRQGNDVIEFSLDFAVLLSDTAEINKRQGYSQAIVHSIEPPKDMLVGPNRIMHMKLDPNKEVQPKFEWANPSPDMDAALKLLETYLSLFLTSQNMDPKTISGTAETTKFNSGFDRLLYMIDKFEASKDDMELYRWVEQQAARLMVKWSNLLQGATVQGGVKPLDATLQGGSLPEDVFITIQYSRPEATQSPTEIEDSQIKQLESGLTTRRKAIMMIHGVDETVADQLIGEIDKEMAPLKEVIEPPPEDLLA